jgi:hypothetical protein
MALRARTVFQASLLAAAATLSACASSQSVAQTAPPPPPAQKSEGGLFGLFGGGERKPETAQIGVNSFLWAASLDTLSFMPLESADPIGGLIVTEWWSDPSLPNEWLKVQVYILDTRLRADALSVQVFRRVGPAANQAQTAPVDPDTSAQIENAILTRARLLRLQSVEK